LVALPVLVEGDIEVCRLLPGVVLSEMVARQLITPPSQIPHTRADVAMGHRAHGRLGPHTRFTRSFGGQVKEQAGTWDLPIQAVKYSLDRAAKTFSNTDT
jgi:hypothetical protein